MSSGALRLGLLAEGGGELASPRDVVRSPVAPGDVIEPEFFGSGHCQLRRAIALERRVSEGAIQFVCPLRLRGREARGSDLVTPQSLRMLLAWPQATRAPHASIVLVDADGDAQRLRAIEGVAG